MSIHKCKKCIWSNKIDSNLLFCILPRCIIKEKPSERIAVVKKSVVGCKGRTPNGHRQVK